jgi:ribose 5-phosphate isomerase A
VNSLPLRVAADAARRAAAAAAVDLLVPGMTIGLGSGRAVWQIIDLVAARWPRPVPLRAAVASSQTESLATAAGMDVIELDGGTVLDLMLDGADELDGDLRLIKGGGGALLHEKVLAAASTSFVVVAEEGKRVERLGERFRLPVEVVHFAWRDTLVRLQSPLSDPQLRMDPDGRPYTTEAGHLILDCTIPPGADLAQLSASLNCIPGVVEHGLFIGIADLAILGAPDGTVQTLNRDTAPALAVREHDSAP